MKDNEDKLLVFGEYKVYESMLKEENLSDEKYKVYPFNNRFIVTNKGRCFDLKKFKYLRQYYSPEYDGVKGPYCYFGDYTEDNLQRKNNKVYVLKAVIDTWDSSGKKLYRIDGDPLNNSLDNLTTDEAIGKAAYARFMKKIKDRTDKELEASQNKAIKQETVTKHTVDEYEKLQNKFECAVRDITNLVDFLKEKDLVEEYKTFIKTNTEFHYQDVFPSNAYKNNT